MKIFDKPRRRSWYNFYDNVFRETDPDEIIFFSHDFSLLETKQSRDKNEW